MVALDVASLTPVAEYFGLHTVKKRKATQVIVDAVEEAVEKKA